MRFGLSPSPSPPPEDSPRKARPHRRSKQPKTPPKPKVVSPNKFGLRDSDTSETSEDSSDDDIADMTPKRREPGWDFEPSPPPPRRPDRPPRTKEEKWAQDEFYAAVRLRQRHDPVQEYEDRMRKEGFLLAHNKNREQWEPISNILDSTPDETAKLLANIREKHVEEVRQVLQQLDMRRTKEEQAFKAEWERQDKELLDSIESSIAVSANEARLIEIECAYQAEVQRAREEARKTQEAAAQEAKLRADLVKQQEEAAKLRAAKEVERLRLEKEADEKRKEEADAKQLGLRPPTAMEELAECDKILSHIKTGVMPQVKKTKLHPDLEPNPEWKQQLRTLRRQIITKVGQATNRRGEIGRIVQQLHEILAPPVKHPDPLFLALVYTLTKAIIKQAEEEVTARASTAFPLARIVVSLLEKGHNMFGEVFMAKIIHMTGHWILGAVVERKPGQSDSDYHKRLNYRPATINESTIQYVDRICGLVTLYAAILQTAPTPGADSRSIHSNLRITRWWTWVARLANNPDLMRDHAGPLVLNVAIETAGDRAMEIWPRQVIKLRTVVGQKAFQEGGEDVLGGKDGTSGRVRLALLLERWQRDGVIKPAGKEYDPESPLAPAPSTQSGGAWGNTRAF